MKRLLICLVPWMAMTAAAQQDAPRQVEVVYSNIGPAEAWRVGDECYIAPSTLTAWHWPYTMNGSDATIQAEGRTLKLETKVVHDRVLFPVSPIVDQLGATSKWHGSDELDILGQVRMVTVKDGILTVDTTISCKPHVFSLSDPGRLVIDLRGMTLAGRGIPDLPDTVQVSRTGADSVRVVYEDENVPRISTTPDDATRHFEYGVTFKKQPSWQTGTPNLVNPRTFNAEPTAENPTPVKGEPGQIIARSPVIAAEDSESLQINVPITSPLQSAVRWKRLGLYTFEVTIPGAQFESHWIEPRSESIEKLSVTQLPSGAVLKIQTTRPMGIELTTRDDAVQILMDKPTGNVSTGGSLAGKTIVIDPGHGGHDSGTRAPDGSCQEKDLTLQIGTDVARYLTAAGANVIMTRQDDTFIPLNERADIANRNNASLFISIHVNSNATLNTKRSGTTTYYHGHNAEAELLGECVEHEIANVSGLPELGTLSDLTRFPHTGMAVLHHSNVPAILVETAYITCPTDREKLCSASFQHTMAKAIVQGIRVFFSNAK